MIYDPAECQIRLYELISVFVWIESYESLYEHCLVLMDRKASF